MNVVTYLIFRLMENSTLLLACCNFDERVDRRSRLISDQKNRSSKSLGKFWENALRDLVPFVQFKKREKHPWRSVTFKKVAG